MARDGPRLERPRRPHAGERPAEELRRGSDRDSSPSGIPTTGVRERKVPQLVHLLARGGDQGPRRRDARPWSCARLRSGRRRSDDRRRGGTPPAWPAARASRSPAGARWAAASPSSKRSFCSKLSARAGTSPWRGAGDRSRGNRRRLRPPGRPRRKRRPGRRAGGGRRRRERRGRSESMNVLTPRQVSRPTLTKMAGGSLTFSRAAWIRRGTCRSLERTRRARSVSGA